MSTYGTSRDCFAKKGNSSLFSGFIFAPYIFSLTLESSPGYKKGDENETKVFRMRIREGGFLCEMI